VTGIVRLDPLGILPVVRVCEHLAYRRADLFRRRLAGFEIDARAAPGYACGNGRLLFAACCYYQRDTVRQRTLYAAITTIGDH